MLLGNQTDYNGPDLCAVPISAARVVSLLISDVPGDDANVIGSGPTVADPTTCADAMTCDAAAHGASRSAARTGALRTNR